MNYRVIVGEGGGYEEVKKVNELTATGILLETVFGDEGFTVKKHLVRRTDTGCEYDEAQDFSGFDELTRLHDRLLSGDR